MTDRGKIDTSPSIHLTAHTYNDSHTVFSTLIGRETTMFCSDWLDLALSSVTTKAPKKGVFLSKAPGGSIPRIKPRYRVEKTALAVHFLYSERLAESPVRNNLKFF